MLRYVASASQSAYGTKKSEAIRLRGSVTTIYTAASRSSTTISRAPRSGDCNVKKSMLHNRFNTSCAPQSHVMRR